MSEEEKYKIALFMVIRNSAVMPKGMVLSKTNKEINRMSYETMIEIITKTVDFKQAKKIFEQGKLEYEKGNMKNE